MHQSLDLVAVFLPHRHNKAAVALRDDVFLQIFLIGRRTHQPVEHLARLCAGAPDFTADIAKRGAGRVGNFILRYDRRRYGALQ